MSETYQYPPDFKLTETASCGESQIITSEQPSARLRFVERPMQSGRDLLLGRILQQLWYVTTYRGLEVEQVEEWRDVPLVVE